LGYQKPDVVYATGQGGGAKVIGKFRRLPEQASTSLLEDNTAHSGNTQQIFCCT
jgi:hypothetical protein